MSTELNFDTPKTASSATILVSGTVPAGQTLAVALQLTVTRSGAAVPQYFSIAKQYTAADMDLIVSDTIQMAIVPQLFTGDTVSFNGFSSLLAQLA
jgi:hypothetical protein